MNFLILFDFLPKEIIFKILSFSQSPLTITFTNGIYTCHFCGVNRLYPCNYILSSIRRNEYFYCRFKCVDCFYNPPIFFYMNRYCYNCHKKIDKYELNLHYGYSYKLKKSCIASCNNCINILGFISWNKVSGHVIQ